MRKILLEISKADRIVGDLHEMVGQIDDLARAHDKLAEACRCMKCEIVRITDAIETSKAIQAATQGLEQMEHDLTDEGDCTCDTCYAVAMIRLENR